MIFVKLKFLSSNYRQVSTFLAVGATSFVIDFGVFNALLNKGIDPLQANAVSLFTSALVGYLGNLKLTFYTNQKRIEKESFMQFMLVGILSVIYAQVILAIVLHLIASPSVLLLNVVKFFTIVSSSIGRFLVYKFYIFK